LPVKLSTTVRDEFYADRPKQNLRILKNFQIKTMKFLFPCGLRNMTMSTGRIKIIIVLLKLAKYQGLP